MTSPQLVVNQQDSLAKLLLTTKNGVPRDVHVVVKNTPFNVVLGIANNFPRNRPERIDLSKSTITVDVHYDSDDPKEGKEVKLLTSKPCEYKVHLSDKRFDEATLEVRMKVLTSQHEDMLFRLHLTLTSENSPHVLRTTTAAIKVVSKPDQVRRINGEKGKKRTHSDIVNESLDRIEKRQQQQQALLLRILKNNTSNPPVGGSSGEFRLSSSIPLEDQPSPSRVPQSMQHLQHLRAQTPAQQQQQQQQHQQQGSTTVSIPVLTPETKASEDVSFEAAFALCMKKYAALPQNERPAKIRKVVSTSTSRDTRSIAEFSEALKVEGGVRLFPEVKKPHPATAPAAAPLVAPSPPFSSAPIAPSPFCPAPQAPFHPVKIEGQQPTEAFIPTDFPLSGSLSFSEDPALTSDFVHDMFQNASLSPFHF